MAKQRYYLTTDPSGKQRTILAETKFHAIAKACGLDDGKYSFSQYKCKKTKL
jgi:hypothetical protein